MKSKKFISVLLLASMMVVSTACGSSNKETAQNETKTSSTEEVAKKQTITAWAWDPNFNIAALEEAKKTYEEAHPNVDLEIVEMGQNDVVQKLNAGLSSGSTDGLPNIVLIEDYRIQTFLLSYPGAFIDLKDKINHDDFAQYKKEFMSTEDGIYGVPFDTGVTGLYYRTDLIEQAGYTNEDMNNLTWDKYIEIGKAVKEKTGVYMTTLDPNDLGLFRIMMQSANSWYVKDDGVTPNFEENQVMAESAAVFSEILNSGIAKVTSEWSQMVGALNNGETATTINGCWITPSITAEASQSGKWAVAPLPKLSIEGSTSYSNLGGSSWYVLNEVENSDVAVDFMSNTFGNNVDLYQSLLNNNGVVATYLPASSGEAYSQNVEFFGGQSIYSDFANWSNKIPQVNFGLHTYAFEDIMKVEMQNILNGGDINTSLQNANKQAKTQIQ